MRNYYIIITGFKVKTKGIDLKNKPRQQPKANKLSLDNSDGMDFIISGLTTSQIFLAAIFFIILGYTFYFARDLLVPFTIALLISFLLSPGVKLLQMIYIPPQIGAALIILIGLLIFGYGCYTLAQPATSWVNKGPEAITKVNERLDKLGNVLSFPIKMISKVDDVITTFSKKIEFEKKEVPQVKESQFMGTFFTTTWQFLLEFCVFIILLYLLLISNDFFLRRIVHWASSLEKKKEAVIIARQVQRDIWKYLFAKTIINISIAIVVSILMFFLGMPDPILWGVMAGILEFIPYVGALVSLFVITLVALFSFTSIGYVFLISFLFFTVISIEGSIITPIIMGRTFTMQPVVVFLSLMFWGWIWGIAGAFIAIPFMMIIKTLIQTLYEVSFWEELLSD